MTSTTITNETSKLSVSLLSIAIAIVGTFLKAWVATILWGWFITPLTAVPTPGLWLMCGLAVFVALFSARWQPERNDNGPIDVLARAFVFGVVVPFACLGFGWIYASLGGLA